MAGNLRTLYRKLTAEVKDQLPKFYVWSRGRSETELAYFRIGSDMYSSNLGNATRYSASEAADLVANHTNLFAIDERRVAVLRHWVVPVGLLGLELDHKPGTYLTSSYFGNLGFAYPMALGAKVAKPDTPVVAISGDGGFLFNSQELATAVQHGINAVVVVFNDNAFGNVMRDQNDRFDGRVIGSQLHNPDFVKLAEAYGARGVRANGPEALESAIGETINADAPTLMELSERPMPSPFQLDRCFRVEKG